MCIVLDKISKSFNGRTVLDRVTLSIQNGEALCLAGPSGCGKTTLLNIISGLLRPDSGTVRGLEDRKMACVFQEPRLLPWKTALSNVEFVLPPTMRPEEKRRRAMECLEIVELSGDASKYPSELSGGMAQRVSLARALAADADVVLLDEAFSAIDPALKERIAARLKVFWAHRRPTVIMSCHSEDEAAVFSCRLYKFEGNLESI